MASQCAHRSPFPPTKSTGISFALKSQKKRRRKTKEHLNTCSSYNNVKSRSLPLRAQRRIHVLSEARPEYLERAHRRQTKHERR